MRRPRAQRCRCRRHATRLRGRLRGRLRRAPRGPRAWRGAPSLRCPRRSAVPRKPPTPRPPTPKPPTPSPLSTSVRRQRPRARPSPRPPPPRERVRWGGGRGLRVCAGARGRARALAATTAPARSNYCQCPAMPSAGPRWMPSRYRDRGPKRAGLATVPTTLRVAAAAAASAVMAVTWSPTVPGRTMRESPSVLGHHTVHNRRPQRRAAGAAAAARCHRPCRGSWRRCGRATASCRSCLPRCLQRSRRRLRRRAVAAEAEVQRSTAHVPMSTRRLSSTRRRCAVPRHGGRRHAATADAAAAHSGTCDRRRCALNSRRSSPKPPLRWRWCAAAALLGCRSAGATTVSQPAPQCPRL